MTALPTNLDHRAAVGIGAIFEFHRRPGALQQSLGYKEPKTEAGGLAGEVDALMDDLRAAAPELPQEPQ